MNSRKGSVFALLAALAGCGSHASPASQSGLDAAAGREAGEEPDAADAGAGVDGSGGDVSDAGGDASVLACVAPSTKQVWGRQLFDRTVYSVAVIGTSDIWRGDDSALWHWDGVSWKNVFTQSSGYYFDGLLAFGADDVWSLGDKHLRQWDGAVWTDRAPPFLPNVVWGPSSHDMWALAVIPMSTPNRSTALHWDGTSWVERALPTPPSGGSVVLNAAWGAAPDDVWAVGHTLRASGFGATALHWNGTAWAESGDSQADDRGNLDFVAVGGLSRADVWAIAVGPAAKTGELWHLADGAWTKSIPLPARPDLPDTPQRAVLWSGCAGTLWLAAGGFVASYDGVAWSAFAKMPSTFLFAMSGLGNQLWVAGNGTSDQMGALLTNAPDGPASCGNARLDPGEQCDPPDDVSCTASCQNRQAAASGVDAGSPVDGR